MKRNNKSNKIIFIVLALILFSHLTVFSETITINFDEQRYKDIANTKFYRGGPNTLIDPVAGLDFYIAYGEMFVDPYIVQSAPIIYNFRLWFSPKITATNPDRTDPMSRIVITFDNLQQYVRVDGDLGLGESLSNPYTRISFYKDTSPNNPLYTVDNLQTVEYTNTQYGIKMVIVDSKFLENYLDELEFTALGGDPPEEFSDLVVSNVEVQDGTGPQIQYNFSIQNQGDASTGSSFKNYVYLSTDQSITQSDYKIDEMSCPTLNSGMAFNSSIIQTTVNGVPPGDYYLGIYTDGAIAITESNENNNTGYDGLPMVTIVGNPEEPDIDVSPSPAIFNPAFLGETKYITIAVSNAGSANLQIQTLSIDGPYAGQFGIENSIDAQIIAPGNSLDLDLSYTPTSQGNIGAFLKIYSNDPDENPLTVPLYGESDVSGNMIFNGDFSGDITGWMFSTMGPGIGTGSVDDGVFEAQITNGGSFVWEVTMDQNDLRIGHGNIYTATFDARAASPRDINAWVAMDHEPWTLYNSDYTFSLTTGWQTFTYIFTMGHATDNKAHLGFDFGTSDVNVYLDNISLVEEVQEPEGNLISNWNFANGSNNWNFITQGGSDATGSVDNGEYAISISNGGTNSWDVHLGQDNLLIENGKAYEVSFDAYAASSRSIYTLVGMNTDPWTVYHDAQDISLTTVKQTYTYSFTMNHPTDNHTRFGFDAGSSSVDVFFDNVSICETAASFVENPDILEQVRSFQLYQNYPNPFNPTTTIGYQVDVFGRVILKVYDLNGREIKTLVDVEKQAGHYTVMFDGTDLPSGVYFYKISLGSQVMTRKLMLMK
ncbi:carbohydrate binding domain-containing protein [candidate division KSB1 bacterium]|nr:carbohydrate binding domain-containing protein [candidate division KSB1 bacterium]